MDEVIDPILTLKVIGNQWYWSYEYSDVIDDSIFFDSYMLLEEDLEKTQDLIKLEEELKRITKKYQKYKLKAMNDSTVIFGGRLAEYKYYDMHQVIESALNCVTKIIYEKTI